MKKNLNDALWVLLLLCVAGALFRSTVIANANSREESPTKIGVVADPTQDATGTIQLQNNSAMKLTAKVVGPTAKAVQLDGFGV